jgi:hypothetical protein
MLLLLHKFFIYSFIHLFITEGGDRCSGKGLLTRSSQMIPKHINVPKCEITETIDPHMEDKYVDCNRGSRDNVNHIENRRHHLVKGGANATRQVEFPSPKIEFPSSSEKPGRKSMTELDRSTPSSSPLQFRGTSSVDQTKSNGQIQCRRNDSKFVLYPAALDLPHH